MFSTTRKLEICYVDISELSGNLNFICVESRKKHTVITTKPKIQDDHRYGLTFSINERQ